MVHFVLQQSNRVLQQSNRVHLPQSSFSSSVSARAAQERLHVDSERLDRLSSHRHAHAMEDANTPHEGSTPGSEGDRSARRGERLQERLRKAIERGLEAGASSLNKADELRQVVSDARTPREVASGLIGQIEELKHALVKVVSQETEKFLQNVDVAAELRRAVSGMRVRVKAEIELDDLTAKDAPKPRVRFTTKRED